MKQELFIIYMTLSQNKRWLHILAFSRSYNPAKNKAIKTTAPGNILFLLICQFLAWNGYVAKPKHVVTFTFLK
jgi:hypothetical protein